MTYVCVDCICFAFPGLAGSVFWDSVTWDCSEHLGELLEKSSKVNNSSQSYYICISSSPIVGLIFPPEIIMKAITENSKEIHLVR